MRHFVLSVLIAAPVLHAADVATVGILSGDALTETSGIAASNRDSDLIWAINDSGHSAAIYAVALDGAALGSVQINRARNIDWEDLAAFVLDGTPYLLLADTGDNTSMRSISWIYIVEEPRADAAGRFSGSIDPVARLPFRYEDGPRDCEAVAVDATGDRIVLVSKRDVPAVVYELPLKLSTGLRRPLVAHRIGTVNSLPRPTMKEMLDSPPLGPWRYQPTALDFAPDGRVAALLTYQNLYLFDRTATQGWGDSFATQPRVIRLPSLSQFESVTFAGGFLVVVAEGRAVPVLRIGPAGVRTPL